MAAAPSVFTVITLYCAYLRKILALGVEAGSRNSAQLIHLLRLILVQSEVLTHGINTINKLPRQLPYSYDIRVYGFNGGYPGTAYVMPRTLHNISEEAWEKGPIERNARSWQIMCEVP